MTTKSPFYIIEEFISPAMCEDIIDRLDNYNINNENVKIVKEHILIETRLYPKVEAILPDLESHFKFSVKGVSPFNFEYYPTGYRATNTVCENSIFRNGNWQRINNKDFTCILFLNNYQATPPFDDDFEVYGGNLEFINFGMKIHPSRGTLVTFPSGPNFSNVTSHVNFGELTQMRFHITATSIYNYNNSEFPGNYNDWFKK